ncbi:MAG: hypothetical protein DHS20C14_01250 [Phycisphaeraceae bacterium]|nr:MAG: hypothetical protein DHS20C14_01250 [Phycisphaeraceae bacterium]
MQNVFGVRTAIAATVCLTGAFPASAQVTPVGEVFGSQPGENMPEDWAPCTDAIETNLRGGFSDRLWPGGVVPYRFSANVNSTNQSRARAAMDELEAVSFLEFIPWTDEDAYINFNASSNSNSSPVGYSGNSNGINIVSWSWRFIICHEVMHSLGIWHEQQKPFRNDYVTINWNNIDPDKKNNFQTPSSGLPVGEYNFESIMHYSRCAFSICSCSSCPTISALPEYADQESVMGQRGYLSQGDADTIAFMYNGPNVGDDEHEPNDSFGSPAPIGAGSHPLIMGDESDYFTFTLAERSEVSASVSTDELAWQAITTLHDAGGAQLGFADNGPWDDGDVIETTLDPGTYVLHIEQDVGFYPYTLNLSIVEAPACFADADGNGTLNVDDIDAYVAAFVGGNLAVADCDGSGGLNVDDIDCYVAAFVAGCP